MGISERAALLVVDVQRGFADAEFWGRRNQPEAEGNIEALLDRWQETGRPVVFVRHDSREPGSPLRAESAGNALRGFVERRRGRGSGAELLVTKSVNSAFLGTPDLDRWLREVGVDQCVVVGVQTNMCVETTARMAGNLGYEVWVPLDATYTFDLEGPWGWRLTAEELARGTAVSLHGGGFARVVRTSEVLAAVGG
ncbi:cysteine hydrolase family protein [Streptomyces sp. NPDC005438]|uniref:cysteine hydrolase family protein n=1 Tax=Streptomyces sp. NPDC005438 TaxID=3156880 RepID=UPI0033A15319